MKSEAPLISYDQVHTANQFGRSVEVWGRANHAIEDDVQALVGQTVQVARHTANGGWVATIAAVTDSGPRPGSGHRWYAVCDTGPFTLLDTTPEVTVCSECGVEVDEEECVQAGRWIDWADSYYCDSGDCW